MTIEERAFLYRIISDPDNDAPRLIYADWLEEHGRDDRAELIRLQIKLTELDPDDKEYERIELRCNELIDLNREEWQGFTPDKSISNYNKSLVFERGFVKEVTVGCLKELNHLEEILSIHPATQLHIWGGLSELPDWPFLSRIRELTFGDGELNTIEKVRAILESPFLTSIRKFNFIYCALEESDLEYLGSHPKFQKLEAIENLFSKTTGARILQLLQSPNTTRLKLFDFPDINFSIQEFDAVLKCPFIPHIESLSINPANFLYGDEQLRKKQIESFLNVKMFQNLSKLTLNSGVDDQFISIFTQSAIASQLKLLDITTELITPSSLQKLFQCSYLKGLESLGIRGIRAGDQWESIFAESTFQKLKKLWIFDAEVNDRGIFGLSQSLMAQTVTDLLFHVNAIQDQGAITLATHPSFSNLRKISLALNQIGVAGAKALSQSAIGKLMTWDNLWGNPVCENPNPRSESSDRPLTDWPY